MSDRNETETAVEFCERTRQGIERKSNGNKKEALALIGISLMSTLLAPLFITLGTDVLLGKVVPASLSALASFSTAWLQLRKPQQLWSLYRGAQREIEDEQIKHRFRVAQYSAIPTADDLLVERVAAIALGLHQKWEPLVPNPEALRGAAGAATVN
jgi:hypothetical protein